MLLLSFTDREMKHRGAQVTQKATVETKRGQEPPESPANAAFLSSFWEPSRKKESK